MLHHILSLIVDFVVAGKMSMSAEEFITALKMCIRDSLEHDADEGDDKIEKKARLEQLEPMEIAQYYTNRYHDAMETLNVLPPSIEPHATGHILPQAAA